MKLYVEGGGETAALRSACREGFTKFIAKAGLERRPRVVACGSRRDAYESFRTAVESGETAMLLVDSEEPVGEECRQGASETWLPWLHLGRRQGDGWQKPCASRDTDCHLMVQIMESWFLADRTALKAFFQNGFKENHLPAADRPVEHVMKDEVRAALKKATDPCKTKSPYGKAEHSFKLLALIDAAKVRHASPWARRFVDELQKAMDA